MYENLWPCSFYFLLFFFFCLFNGNIIALYCSLAFWEVKNLALVSSPIWNFHQILEKNQDLLHASSSLKFLKNGLGQKPSLNLTPKILELFIFFIIFFHFPAFSFSVARWWWRYLWVGWLLMTIKVVTPKPIKKNLVKIEKFLEVDVRNFLKVKD
jgi:hypothetical protein